MHQEELLKAIKEQTEAINRQTEAIADLVESFERYHRSFVRVFGTGLEKEAAKILAMIPEQRKENNRGLLAEARAAQVVKKKGYADFMID